MDEWMDEWMDGWMRWKYGKGSRVKKLMNEVVEKEMND